MGVWNFVAEHTFDSPVNQIKLLIQKSQPLFAKKSLTILDAGGGLENRGDLLDNLGKRIVFDIVAGPNVDVVGDIHAMPFPDKSFDVITLFMVMEHLHDPLLAIQECQRVLKPGGVLLGTTVQYWHTHAHPNDYFRYTQFGLEHIFKQSNLPLRFIWSSGGPFLVLYHAIELNLPSFLRKVFLLSCIVFNYLDLVVFNHQDKRQYSDSVGWSFIAQKSKV